jgi:hypothetical protein
MENFLNEFSALSEDDTIALEVLENMKAVFEIFCRWCAATSILMSMILYKYNSDYRRAIDSRSTLATKNLKPASARNILKTYEALFDHACYSVPLMGAFVRVLIKKVGMQAQKTTKLGIFLFTGKRIVTPFRWSSLAWVGGL